MKNQKNIDSAYNPPKFGAKFFYLSLWVLFI